MIPVTNRNVLIITAFIKDGIVTVSYKGQIKKALFSDSTMRNMMKGIRFQDNSFKFLGGVAALLQQLTKPQ